MSGAAATRVMLALFVATWICASLAAAHEAHRRAEPETAPADEAAREREATPPVREPPAEPEVVAQPEPSTPVGLARLLTWLGKLHPSTVHFPIALLLCAGIAEGLASSRRAEVFAPAARFCVWGGALGAVIAAPLGWAFAEFSDTEQGWVLTTHRWLGTALAAWAVLLVALLERAERHRVRGAYRTALLVTAALVVATGFFGGSLLYGLDHLRW